MIRSFIIIIDKESTWHDNPQENIQTIEQLSDYDLESYISIEDSDNSEEFKELEKEIIENEKIWLNNGIQEIIIEANDDVYIDKFNYNNDLILKLDQYQFWYSPSYQNW